MKGRMTKQRFDSKPPFDAVAALKTARGYHDSAALLENIRKEELAGLPRAEPQITQGKGFYAVGFAHVGLDMDFLNRNQAYATSATVLDALALEIVLKVRLARAGLPIPRTHSHTKLFATLPAPERQAAEERYKAGGHPFRSVTLEAALAGSNDVFETWRYLYEEPAGVSASTGEMRRAFQVLAEGL
jgi:hypothetical protein